MAFDRIGFLHLPKAAGTSLAAAVREAYPEEHRFGAWFDRCLYDGFERFDLMAPDIRERFYLGDGSELGGFHVIAGHFSYGTITRTLDPAQVFTVMREPRVRLLSHWFFWRSWPISRHQAYLPYDVQTRAMELDLAGFLRAPWLAPQTDNVMTRMLLWPNSHVRHDRHLVDVDPITRWRIARRARSLTATLGRALPLEMGDRLGPTLSEWCGRSIVLPHLNRTDNSHRPHPREWLTDEVLELLDTRTAFDRLLWDDACRRQGLDPTETAHRTFQTYLAPG